MRESIHREVSCHTCGVLSPRSVLFPVPCSCRFGSSRQGGSPVLQGSGAPHLVTARRPGKGSREARPDHRRPVTVMPKTSDVALYGERQRRSVVSILSIEATRPKGRRSGLQDPPGATSTSRFSSCAESAHTILRFPVRKVCAPHFCRFLRAQSLRIPFFNSHVRKVCASVPGGTGLEEQRTARKGPETSPTPYSFCAQSLRVELLATRPEATTEAAKDGPERLLVLSCAQSRRECLLCAREGARIAPGTPSCPPGSPSLPTT